MPVWKDTRYWFPDAGLQDAGSDVASNQKQGTRDQNPASRIEDPAPASPFLPVEKLDPDHSPEFYRFVFAVVLYPVISRV